MADGSWLLIFRSFSNEDLTDKKESLITEMTTLSSQAVGSKSLSRDLGELKAQLEAIVFVMNERGGDYVHTIVTDFSDTRPAPRSGTQDQLNF